MDKARIGERLSLSNEALLYIATALHTVGLCGEQVRVGVQAVNDL